MGRFALLIGAGRYDDAELRCLSAPARDVDMLGGVLADPKIGGFEVTRLTDRPVQELRVAVEDFLADRTSGDFVLVYLSCHGLLDRRGRLAFATTDTQHSRLGATAVSAVWLRELLDDCRADVRVLVLDCCFSGAHDRAKTGADSVAAQLGEVGRGHAVLTACGELEYSFEGDSSGGSVFTSGLVEGIRTGKADRNGDGWVTVEDAYTYAASYVRRHGNDQHPQRWLTAVEGDLMLARSPLRPRTKPKRMPDTALYEGLTPEVEHTLAAVVASTGLLRHGWTEDDLRDEIHGLPEHLPPRWIHNPRAFILDRLRAADPNLPPSKRRVILAIERGSKFFSEHRDRLHEAERNTRRAAIDACPLCDHNGILDLGDDVPLLRCNHDPDSDGW